MTNIATNMTTFVLINPLNASAGSITPVMMSDSIIPAEITENGIFPVIKATIVSTKISNVISNGVICSSNFS